MVLATRYWSPRLLTPNIKRHETYNRMTRVPFSSRRGGVSVCRYHPRVLARETPYNPRIPPAVPTADAQPDARTRTDAGQDRFAADRQPSPPNRLPVRLGRLEWNQACFWRQRPRLSRRSLTVLRRCPTVGRLDAVLPGDLGLDASGWILSVNRSEGGTVNLLGRGARGGAGSARAPKNVVSK